MPATHCQGPHALAVASKALQATNESLNFSFYIISFPITVFFGLILCSFRDSG